MTAFYFGGPDRPLFGFYHAAEGPSRAAGIVVCPPQGHEYIRSHRALRMLADLLAQRGFPVLRFDYYGCGDSAGDLLDSDLERWGQDVRTAIDECRARSGRDRIAAVGMRLGGSLALLATAGHGVLDALVLWDPIVEGGPYLRELETLNLERRSTRWRQAPAALPGGPTAELVGFRYPRRLLDQLTALDLARVDSFDGAPVLLVETVDPGEAPAPPSRALGSLAGRVERLAVRGSKTWQERSGAELDGAFVPRTALEPIVRWLETVDSSHHRAQGSS